MTLIAGCKRLVAWGGRGYEDDPHHSHRHIWSSYVRTAQKLGIEAVWLPGTPDDRLRIGPGDLVLAVDIWAHELWPAKNGAKYVLHNFGSQHPIFDSLEPEQFVRLQVYSKNAHGEKIGPCRYWVKENRTLIMPWGTDLLAEEFWEPVFNGTSRDAVFVGAIWNTDGQGNASTISELRKALAQRGLQFVHKTQITDDEMIMLVRNARLAPAIAGDWQVENNYLPCRVFKNVSYGQLAVTNVPRFYDLFGAASLQATSVEGLVDEALSIRHGQFAEMVLAQQRVVAQFTYRESLAAIDQVFAE